MKKYITKKNDEEIEEEIRKGKKSKNINVSYSLAM